MGRFDFSVGACYNWYMTMIDETREEIVAKIEAKKVALDKKKSKPKNLSVQKQTYLKAIEEHKAKIAKLEELIAKIDESDNSVHLDLTLGRSEVKHMEEILARYDQIDVEREQCSTAMTKVYEEYAAKEADIVHWNEDGVKASDAVRDKRYVDALARRDWLETMKPECLADVRRIFYSRGKISDFNKKGRKGV